MSMLPRRWHGKDSSSRGSAYRSDSSSFRSISDEKPIMPQRQTSNASDKSASSVSSVSPMSVVFPPLHVVNPETRDSVLAADTPQQRNPAPFTPPRLELRPTSSFLGSKYNPNENLDNLDLADYNNTYNTNATLLSNNTSNAYDPAQKEVNHLSYLSSLSSGFGDQVIVPEPGTTRKSQAPRQSRKFSWVSSAPNRDTVYTATSVETAPRFRTVNSWVAQQTGRVERQLKSDKEVPAMPAVPLPLRAAVDHQRKQSEDPAFRHHPGQEIDFQKGARVASFQTPKTSK